MELVFEWDPRKATANRAKHRVSFEEAVTAFGDPLGRVQSDPRHSVSEERQVLLGRSATGRLLPIMFTDRGASRLRVISARLATRRERTIYEEAGE
jgi:uncharacterized DUF497 family protein